MGQALYRKYRSKSLREIVGQDHITKTLKNALKQGKISHAYLLTGPKGVGKTSVARILAHEINDLPYEGEQAHLDIIEIDAASNRRIDEIRDLRDKVHTMPTTAKYKVYIIDEVHMLTKEAFNALLKTLEEPPQHVVFILATTEAHKLPDTIVSRTQRFTFKPIDETTLASHLRSIADSEGLTIDDEALRLISQHGSGSFRDSISLLDQLSGSAKQKISVKDVQTILGIAPDALIDNLIKVTFSGDVKGVVTLLTDIEDQGFQAAQVTRQLLARLREMLLDRDASVTQTDILALLKELVDVPASSDPSQQLELTLIGEALKTEPAEQSNHTEPKPIEKKAQPLPVAAQKPLKKARPTNFSLDSWQQVLDGIKQKQPSLYSILRMATPSWNGKDTLTLAFRFPLHQKRLREAKTQHILIEQLKAVGSEGVLLDIIVDKTAKTTQKQASKAHMDSVTSVFGGAELL